MIKCNFENGDQVELRHITANGIVIKGQQILLMKRSSTSFLEGGKWSPPGGFLDRDETVSEGVLREIKEETGYGGKIISLLRINSNPNRPKEDRQNVDFVFIVEAQEKDGEPDKESSEIKWFALNNLPPEADFAFDHYDNIVLYKKYLQEKFPLPVLV
jgi:8-oxo-dGTP diphosphatase